MKNLIAFFCVLYLTASLGKSGEVLAQSQFQLTIGGTGDDYGTTIIQTSDGGYAVAGYGNSFGTGGYDMCIVKFDASGTLQWSRSIGGPGDDAALSIAQASDGGYAVAGYTTSGAGGRDMCIIRLDANGIPEWGISVGGTGDDYPGYLGSITQTPDGGYIVAGNTTSFGAGNWDMFFVKVSSGGALEWCRTMGTSEGERPQSIVRTTDGGYAAAGYAGVPGSGVEMGIVKLDANGMPQWNRTVGGTANDYAHSIIQTTDGGYVICGYAISFGAGANDVYAAKFDASGNLQWTKVLGTTGYEVGWSLIQTTDGGYSIAGQTSAAGGSDVYIIKLRANGSHQWSKSVNVRNWDVARSIIQTADGGYVAAGETFVTFERGGSDIYVLKLNSQGNTCNSNQIKTKITTGGTTTSPSLIVSPQTPFIATMTLSTGTGGSITTICSAGNGALSRLELQEQTNLPQQFKLEQNYPNPFNPETSIKYQIANISKVKLTVFDVLGHEIFVLVNREQEEGSYEIEWDASNYPSGVYYYQLTAGDFKEVKKMVLVK